MEANRVSVPLKSAIELLAVNNLGNNPSRMTRISKVYEQVTGRSLAQDGTHKGLDIFKKQIGKRLPVSEIEMLSDEWERIYMGKIPRHEQIKWVRQMAQSIEIGKIFEQEGGLFGKAIKAVKTLFNKELNIEIPKAKIELPEDGLNSMLYGTGKKAPRVITQEEIDILLKGLEDLIQVNEAPRVIEQENIDKLLKEAGFCESKTNLVGPNGSAQESLTEEEINMLLKGLEDPIQVNEAPMMPKAAADKPLTQEEIDMLLSGIEEPIQVKKATIMPKANNDDLLSEEEINKLLDGINGAS